VSCGSICIRTVVIAGVDESVREGARRMAREDVGALVVLDEAGKLIGMLTDRDVVVRCLAAGRDPVTTTIVEVMTAPVVAVQETTPIEDALSKMVGARVRRLPVLDEKGELVGILALDDVLELLAEETATIGRLLRRAPLRRPE